VTKLDELNAGLQVYHDNLLSDSLAAQRVEVSIITFGQLGAKRSCPSAQPGNSPYRR